MVSTRFWMLNKGKCVSYRLAAMPALAMRQHSIGYACVKMSMMSITRICAVSPWPP